MLKTTIILLCLQLIFTVKTEELVLALPAICLQPPSPGPCRAAIPRYYFNEKDGKCEKFIYGGCGGNKNNFKTKKDCEDKCKVPQRG